MVKADRGLVSTRVGCLALLLLWLAAPAAAAAGKEDSRAAAENRFRTQLAALAVRCDTLGLGEQAQLTRNWYPPRDPRRRRQWIAVPVSTDPLEPPPGADDLVRKWYERFRELRRGYANELFGLARGELDASHADTAYRLLHDVLREDPDHAEARRILGYRRVGGAWRKGSGRSSARVATVPHPNFGWARRAYWIIDTDHFHVTTNHSAAAGEKLAGMLEDLYVVWQQLFFDYWSRGARLSARWSGGAPALDPQHRFEVVLFRDRDDYVRNLERIEPLISKSIGYYLKKNALACFYWGDNLGAATWYHEATHQFFQEVEYVVPQVGEARNFWVIEGAALYMESLCPRTSGLFTVGGFDAQRLQYARYRALSEKFYVPLERFIGYGREALQQDADLQKLYSEAAGLTHFLMDGQDGRYTRALVAYLHDVYQGQDDSSSLARRCGATLETLDEQYHEFLAVTDADLAFLGPPECVTDLCLAQGSITDAAAEPLAALQRLEWLDLGSTQVGDATAASLRRMTRMRQLNLEKTHVTDKSLALIGRLRTLEELDLSDTRITDAGLAELGDLNHLRVLWLTNTPISDASLNVLEKLQTLETLQLSGTQITADGRRQLRAKLPKWKTEEQR